MRRKLLVVLMVLSLSLTMLIPFANAATIVKPVPSTPITVDKAEILDRLANLPQVKDRIVNNELDVVGENDACGNRGFILVAPDNVDLDELIAELQKEVPSLKVIYRYKYVFNGIGGYVNSSDYLKLKALAGQMGVSFHPSKKYTVQGWPSGEEPMMAFSTELIKSNIVNAEGYTGEGTVVAILDTGIRPDHEFFYKDGTEPAKGTPWTELVGPDKKFIGGYDFAGEDYCNQIPDDDPTVGPDYQSVEGHPHGTHVAGTVAGVEGTFTKGTISVKLTGVAPDAQLYIAKVFPGNPPFYATDFAIIGAVEKLIELKKSGVNIVAANMSLGATFGFDNPYDPEQIAIEKAIQEGIAFAISAGNSGYFLGSSYPKATDTIYPLNLNTLGSPGATPDAITVAAANNSARIVQGFRINKTVDAGYGETDMIPYLTSSHSEDPANVFEGPQVLAIADPTNLTACNADDVVDLTGKVALIKRGDCAFATKVLNAYEKGAVGVIVWNHESGGDTFVDMYLGFQSPIPAVFIWNSYGNILNEMLSQGEEITAEFVGSIIVPSDTMELGDFSSWGALPSLLLKPDIAAPGVDITSAVIDSPISYETWNGTSMAAPHIAGAIAVLKDAYPDLTPAQIKQILMNHTDVLLPSSANISPRKQGAGRVNLEKAIKYAGLKVESTGFANEEFNGKPSVSLGVIEELPTSFSVKITNGMDEAVDLSVKVLAFSAATKGFGAFSATVTANTDSLFLEPGASQDITLTIEGVSLIGWVEGFVMFYEDEELVASIPFAGIFNPGGPYYYGEGWQGGAMPAVDWPWWSENRYYDYFGTRYGSQYADYSGFTALYNRWYYKYIMSDSGAIFYEKAYYMPAGVDDISVVGASLGTCSPGLYAEFGPAPGAEYKHLWSGSPMSTALYDLGSYKVQVIDDMVLNLTVMRGVVKYDVEIVNEETGEVIDQYSTGDLWSGVIRKGWSRNYHANYLVEQPVYEDNIISLKLGQLPEGRYVAKVYVYPRPVINPYAKEYNYEPQIIQLPFGIDITPPEGVFSLDFRSDGKLVVYMPGNSDNLTGVIGLNITITMKKPPADADDADIFIYVPAKNLPYTIDLTKLTYYTTDGEEKPISLDVDEIESVSLSVEDGAHNLNGSAINVPALFNVKNFYVGGGYTLVTSDGSYKINPKAYFGADEVYKIEGGKVKPIQGKPYNEFVPNLVDASGDDIVEGGVLYLIRRDAPGYVFTYTTENFDITAEDQPLMTSQGVLAVSFAKDVAVSDIVADANLVKVYEAYLNGSQIRVYSLKVTPDLVLKAGHDYLLVFDGDTEVTIGK